MSPHHRTQQLNQLRIPKLHWIRPCNQHKSPHNLSNKPSKVHRVPNCPNRQLKLLLKRLRKQKITQDKLQQYPPNQNWILAMQHNWPHRLCNGLHRALKAQVIMKTSLRKHLRLLWPLNWELRQVFKLHRWHYKEHWMLKEELNRPISKPRLVLRMLNPLRIGQGTVPLAHKRLNQRLKLHP